MASLARLALYLGALLPGVLAAPPGVLIPPPAVLAPAPHVAPIPFDPAELDALERRKDETIPGKYIVLLKDSAAVNTTAHLDWVADVHRRSIAGRNLKGIEKTYNISTFSGYAGEFDNITISEIKANPDVATVIPDYVMHLYGAKEKRWKKTQNDAPWGLGAISHRTPGKNSYIYDSSAGSGTYAYILDSGLQTTHKDFGGRASYGYNALYGKNEDRLGHGTHAAGIIGGSTYGVAKKAKLISVKVFGADTSVASYVLDGFAWAVNDIVDRKRTTKAVINMSLGGPQTGLWTRVIDAAHKKGVLCIVAAGNGDDYGAPQPVSSMSPADVVNALTVSAVDKEWKPAAFANYGPGIDVYAPGMEIESTTIGASDKETETLNGTSMAAPHVAGLALYLMGNEKLKTPDAVKARIKQLATSDKITGSLSGGPNLLAFNGNSA